MQGYTPKILNGPIPPPRKPKEIVKVEIKVDDNHVFKKFLDAMKGDGLVEILGEEFAIHDCRRDEHGGLVRLFHVVKVK